MSCSKIEPPPSVTCDAFLGGRLRVLQPEPGPRAGIDAIFLAAAVPARAGRVARVLDAGMGHGVVALALAARVADAHVTGVEIQPELAALARDNAARNGMADRVQAIRADLTWPMRRLVGAGLATEGYDHVAANPPFHTEGRTRAAAHAVKARAHAGAEGMLGQWIAALTGLTAPKGTVTLIHRADALGAMLGHLEGRFGGLVVYPLFPRAGQPAARILVQGIKGSRAPLRLAAGLVLHNADGGAFTAEAERVLRDGASLDLSR